MPAGALAAGVAAHVVGAQATVAAMGGLVILLALLISWRVPVLRKIAT
jgi:hypothetical protein